jgi:hypothetical protein
MDDPQREDTMRRTHQALAVLALGLALISATTAVAAAATPPTGTQDQAGSEKLAEHGLLGQHKTLDQSEPARTQAGSEKLAEHGLLAQRKALYQSEPGGTLARHRALGAVAAQPAARTDPAAPSPGVDVVATLLVGLVGGLVGGAAAMLGWTATTRRRRPQAAAGT